MDYIVSVKGVSKSYGEVQALKDVCFEVKPGEILGLIGPDGAGKTTLFRILTTLVLADEGKAEVCGQDVVKNYKEIRRQAGYMPGRFSLYQDLSVEENLTFFATLFNTTIRENYALVKDIYQQIEPFKHRRAGKLSGGMKQKLALSCALIHRPSILFLDEPTTGVDPVSRKEFWDMLGRLKNDGITILVSTPYMDEAGRCDRIALIRNGKFLTVNSPAGIIAEFPDRLYSVRSDRMHALLGDLRAYSGTIRAFSFGESVHLSTGDGFSEDDLRKFLQDRKQNNVEINAIRPSVEDCFMRI